MLWLWLAAASAVDKSINTLVNLNAARFARIKSKFSTIHNARPEPEDISIPSGFRIRNPKMPSPIVSRELFEDFLLYSINFEFVMYGPLDLRPSLSPFLSSVSLYNFNK